MVESTTSFHVSCEAITANANTVFSAISHNPTQELTAYACANMVLVADMQNQKKVYFSLGGHTTRVNSV